jgi:hypothetical protein
MVEFAAAFRQHVIPRLQTQVRELAWDGWDQDFSASMEELHGTARRHGAGYLAPEHWDDLDDWLAKTLIDEIEASEREREEADKFVASMLRAPDRSVIRISVRSWVKRRANG